MATFRLVWEFIESNGSSFSEVFYKDAGTVEEALIVGPNLITARRALLHSLNTLVRIRASQTDKLRVTGVSPLNQSGTANIDSGPAPVGVSVVCQLGSSAGGQRKVWLRGCPNAWISRSNDSGIDTPPPDLQKALANWFSKLAGAFYGIRKLTPATPGPLTNIKISQVDGTAKNGTSILTLANAPGYPFPGQVVIGGASKKDLPSLNGTFSLVAAPANNLITIPYQTPGGLLVLTQTAHVRQAVFLPTAVFSSALCAFDHFGTHTSKNPLSRSRGARRAARLRSSL